MLTKQRNTKKIHHLLLLLELLLLACANPAMSVLAVLYNPVQSCPGSEFKTSQQEKKKERKRGREGKRKILDKLCFLSVDIAPLDHIIHLKYMQYLFLNQTLVKLEEKDRHT